MPNNFNRVLRSAPRRSVAKCRQVPIRMGALQLVEHSHHGLDVGEIGQKLVRGMLEDFFI